MGRRQDFHAILVSLFDPGVKACVKYQPGPSVTLTYPCMVYKLNDMPSIWANNLPYHWEHRYELQVIDRDPDSKLREKVIALPMCRFARSFVADNLHHYVFDIYY
jgi:hypothetical protein